MNEGKNRAGFKRVWFQLLKWFLSCKVCWTAASSAIAALSKASDKPASEISWISSDDSLSVAPVSSSPAHFFFPLRLDLEVWCFLSVCFFLSPLELSPLVFFPFFEAFSSTGGSSFSSSSFPLHVPRAVRSPSPSLVFLDLLLSTFAAGRLLTCLSVFWPFSPFPPFSSTSPDAPSLEEVPDPSTSHLCRIPAGG